MSEFSKLNTAKLTLSWDGLNQELLDYLDEHDLNLNQGEFNYCTEKYKKRCQNPCVSAGVKWLLIVVMHLSFPVFLILVLPLFFVASSNFFIADALISNQQRGSGF